MANSLIDILWESQPKNRSIRAVNGLVKALGFCGAASRLVLRFHDDGNGTYPRRRSKRSVWKKLRAAGRNPGGYATR